MIINVQRAMKEANYILGKIEDDKYKLIKSRKDVECIIDGESHKRYFINNKDRVLVVDHKGKILESNFKIKLDEALKQNITLKQWFDYGLNKVFKEGDNQ